MNPTIKTAINIVGSQKKLGEACDVSQQAVYKWLHNKAKVSPEHVNSIVNATNGEV
ncbi:YdaS family helix-turn-helix protein, partial [Klebsiella pneumoniae]